MAADTTGDAAVVVGTWDDDAGDDAANSASKIRLGEGRGRGGRGHGGFAVAAAGASDQSRFAVRWQSLQVPNDSPRILS